MYFSATNIYSTSLHRPLLFTLLTLKVENVLNGYNATVFAYGATGLKPIIFSPQDEINLQCSPPMFFPPITLQHVLQMFSPNVFPVKK